MIALWPNLKLYVLYSLDGLVFLPHCYHSEEKQK